MKAENLSKAKKSVAHCATMESGNTEGPRAQAAADAGTAIQFS